MARAFLFLFSLFFLADQAFCQVSKEDLIRLVETGVDQELIVSLVEKDCVDFEVDADVILELKELVPDDVLRAVTLCDAADAAPPASAESSGETDGGKLYGEIVAETGKPTLKADNRIESIYEEVSSDTIIQLHSNHLRLIRCRYSMSQKFKERYDDQFVDIFYDQIDDVKASYDRWGRRLVRLSFAAPIDVFGTEYEALVFRFVRARPIEGKKGHHPKNYGTSIFDQVMRKVVEAGTGMTDELWAELEPVSRHSD